MAGEPAVRRNGRTPDHEPERLLIPNSTQIPNVMLDLWMALFPAGQFNILLYIARRTFGFGKATDAVTIDQLCRGIVTKEGKRLDWGTQLGRRTVQVALAELIARGVVHKEEHWRENGQQAANTYGLNLSWAPDWTPGEKPPPVEREGESDSAPPVQVLQGEGAPGFAPQGESDSAPPVPGEGESGFAHKTQYSKSSVSKTNNNSGVKGGASSTPSVARSRAPLLLDPNLDSDTDPDDASEPALSRGGQLLHDTGLFTRARAEHLAQGWNLEWLAAWIEESRERPPGKRGGFLIHVLERPERLAPEGYIERQQRAEKQAVHLECGCGWQGYVRIPAGQERPSKCPTCVRALQ